MYKDDVNRLLFGDNGSVRNAMQALGEKYGLLPGYEEEVKKTTREPKNKGVGKKTLPLQPEQTEVKALLLSPCGRPKDQTSVLRIRIRFLFDADPKRNPNVGPYRYFISSIPITLTC
jgi:hypothetical protein